MKDAAIPQTLMQVDRGAVKYCRTYSGGEITTSWSVPSAQQLQQAELGRVCCRLCCCMHLYWDLAAWPCSHASLLSLSVALQAGKSSHRREPALLSSQSQPGCRKHHLWLQHPARQGTEQEQRDRGRSLMEKNQSWHCLLGRAFWGLPLSLLQ